MKSKHTFHARVATALFAALVAMPAAQAASPAKDPEFKKFDTNGDGYISRDEAGRVRGFDKALTEADGNRDGRLDPGEFVKAQAVHERMRAGQYIADSVVTAKVKTALLKDLRLKGFNIEVETYKGTVQLSGFVDNREQVRRAAEVAAGVEGVAEVKNSLLVKS